MKSIPVTTELARYTVHVGHGLLQELPERLRGLLGTAALQKLFVLSSPPVWSIWGAAFEQAFAGRAELCVMSLPAGEAAKRLGSVEQLAEEMALAGADRGSVLVAFGGGIVGDVGGFLAAGYMRGIRYVQVPTTLLAQVDSSVGGKTGVNLRAGKNLFGAFHHPLAVYADLALLTTLPERELRAGLVECVKAGLIRDARLFDDLEAIVNAHGTELPRDADWWEQVVARSVAIKAEIVHEDERESGLRMLLNLGHTVGHALESATGYTALLHGEAVGWGLLAAFALAVQRGTVTAAEAARVGALVRKLAVAPDVQVSADVLLRACGTDKKNRGGVRRFVLPRGLGDAAVVEDVSDAELHAAIGSMLAQMRDVAHG